MLLEKDYQLKATAKQLIDFITDMEQAVTCIPNLDSYEKLSETKLRLIVKPNFSFIKTRLTMVWEIVSVGPTSGALHLTGKGIGSSFEADVSMKLSQAKEGSKAHLKIDYSVGGMLKHVPESLIKGAAGTLADDMISNADEKCAKSQ